MRKFITILIVSLAGIMAFSSCDLKMSDDYKFQRDAGWYILGEEGKKDTERAEAIEKYLKSVLDFEEVFSYSGPQYDAMQYGFKLFQEDVVKFDEAKIKSFFKDDEEWISFGVYMIGDSFKGPIITTVWTKNGVSNETNAQ